MSDHSHGISEYKNLAGGCLKRHFEERDLEPDGGPDAAFGTAMHAWLAAYHFGGLEPALSEEIPEKGYVSPAELARRYRRRFSPLSLGHAVAVNGKVLVEERLSMVVEGDNWKAPFAGTLDSPVMIDDAAVEVIKRERGITLYPGLYLIDHKTKSRKPEMAQYLSDPQFTGYHKLFQALTGETLMGTLVNFLIRYKDDKAEGFQTLLVGPPGEDDILVWKGMVRDGAARLHQLGRDWKDATKCFDWNRRCPLFDQCARHNL